MEANRLDQTKCPHCGLTSVNSLWDEETSKHFDAPILPISSATREGEASFICPNCHCESDGVTNYDEMLQQTDKDELIRQQQAEIERLRNLSTKDVYDLTVMQSKLDSALQTIEAYKTMEQELERLNRAYEVLERKLKAISPAAHKVATKEAHRIKEGDGKQG